MIRNPLDRWPAALVAAGGLALVPLAADAQALSNCGCDQVRQMRDRYCSARAARAEYERIESFLRSEENRTGQGPRMYSTEDKRMINQKCVQEAINRVSDRNADKATGETTENFPTQTLVGMDECRILVTRDDKNACLKQIIETHEAMHRAACLKRNKIIETGRAVLTNVDLLGKLGLKVIGDTKFILATDEFALEEAASYAAEMQFISAKWKQLQQDCIAKAFEAELTNAETVGQALWDNAPKDANGNRIYKMYDLSNDPCPSHPPPPKSECTLK